MFLKLEEVAEERQTVVRCGGVNQGSGLPVATSALEGVVVHSGIRLRCREQVTSGHIVMKRAHADAAAGKPGAPVGTPQPDRVLPLLFDVG